MKRWVIFLFCILTLVSIFTACEGNADSPESATPSPTQSRTPSPTSTSTCTSTPKNTSAPVLTPITYELTSTPEDEQTIADYTKAIELDPELVIAYFLRGNAYESMQKYEQAFDDFTKVIELNPEFEPAYRERGGIYLRWEQYDEAIADLTKAVELDPEDYYGYYIRGFIYEKLGQSDLAIADFEKAITDYTEHPYYLEAYCSLANIYLNQGRNDLAAKYYETGSTLTDDIFWCWLSPEEVKSLTETP